MATAIIFGAPGAGKTVNSTLVPGKTLLLMKEAEDSLPQRFLLHQLRQRRREAGLYCGKYFL